VPWLLAKNCEISNHKGIFVFVITNRKNSPLLGPLQYGNIYDDCNFPASKPGTYFKADMLIISAQIAAQVLPVHTEHLAKNMNQI